MSRKNTLTSLMTNRAFKKIVVAKISYKSKFHFVAWWFGSRKAVKSKKLWNYNWVTGGPTAVLFIEIKMHWTSQKKIVGSFTVRL